MSEQATENKEAETKKAAAPQENIKELGLVAKKIGMTQVFDEEGNVVPVTVLQLAENVVTAVKTVEKDGYNAIQVGNFVTKEQRLNKPQLGFLKKNKLPLVKKLQEFRLPDDVVTNLNVGDVINAAEFFEGIEKVNITGKSIGKGFQGGVKLHNMHVGRRSHGSKSKRQIGSLGAGTYPGRVFKGKRMPSMMGNRIITTTKVKFFKHDAEKNLVLLKGSVPGKTGTEITIKACGLKAWNAENKKKQIAA